LAPPVTIAATMEAFEATQAQAPRGAAAVA
jgi:hypothetical protein